MVKQKEETSVPYIAIILSNIPNEYAGVILPIFPGKINQE
jgi:hypothetical protein